jgi:hypothetical protein
MRKAILILILVSFVAGSALAQMPDKPITFYLQGGATKPLGDFEDAYKIGFWGGGGIGFSFIPLLEAVGRVSYFRMSPDYPEDVDIDGGDLGILTYGVEGKVNLGSSNMRLFALAGAGWAAVKFSDIKGTYTVGDAIHDIPTPKDATENYMCLGAGIEFGQLFIEARGYKILKDVKLSKFNGDPTDADFTFAAASIGLKF